MLYPTISMDDARAVLSGLKARRGYFRPEVIERGRGDPFDRERVDDLIDELHDLRLELGEKDGDRRYWMRFEGRGARVVHSSLALSAQAAADPGFWMWIVFGHEDTSLVRYVDWRFGADEAGAREANYGISHDLAEGFFSRMWLRGDIAFDPEADDPYWLAYRGDQDLWRSHVFRQDYGSAREVARALVRFQYPDDHPQEATVGTTEIRAIAKELRKRHATIAMELLSGADADRLIREVRASISQS